MKVKTAIVTVLAAMLAVTSCLADPFTDTVRNHPTADLSNQHNVPFMDYLQVVQDFAETDAMLFMQDHPDWKWDISYAYSLGHAHAYKHNLTGDNADTYATK